MAKLKISVKKPIGWYAADIGAGGKEFNIINHGYKKKKAKA